MNRTKASFLAASWIAGSSKIFLVGAATLGLFDSGTEAVVTGDSLLDKACRLVVAEG
jgi:hypothetical protein